MIFLEIRYLILIFHSERNFLATAYSLGICLSQPAIVKLLKTITTFLPELYRKENISTYQRMVLWCTRPGCL